MRFFTSFGTLVVLLIGGFLCILGDAARALLFPAASGRGNQKTNTSPAMRPQPAQG